MPLTRTIVLCAIAGAAVAADGESWILRSEEPWSFTWEERRLANDDGVSMPGFGRTALPVQAGVWGEVGAGARGALHGRADSVPGTAPLPTGGSGQVWGDAWLAGGPFFLHLHPEAVISHGEIADPVARDVWTGGDPTTTLDTVEVAPRASLGVTGLGHVLALSNEPFRWGDGIFGGVMLGQAWRGFPHLVLASRGPQSLAPAGSWLEPLAIGYEFIAGQLAEASPTAGDGVRFAGMRVAVRYDAVTLSYAKSMLYGGSSQPAMPWRDVWVNVIRPRNGNDGAVPVGSPDPNRFSSLGVRLDWPRHVAWSLDYGIDDQNPRRDGQRINTTLTQEARYTTAAWTATADWLDITGDGDWRLALEWFRSESYVYGHGTYPWSDGGFPLAHADGGNADSLRLLTQHVDGDDGRWTVIATWRRQGWRNAESGNPNDARNDPGVPGSGTFAKLAWDHYALDGRYEVPLGQHWRWWCEGGAAWDVNRGFDRTQDRADGWVGLGAARSW